MSDAEFQLAQEKTRAVDALVYRLKHRGDADDEVLALEYITALIGQGWRPTTARPLPDWHYRGDGEKSPLPDPDNAGGSAYLEAKAALLSQPPARPEAS